MNRRKARENAFLAQFALGFGGSVDEQVAHSREDGEFEVDDFGEGLLQLVQRYAAEVDQEIESHLKGWRVQRLQKVSLTLLRLSVAEMLYGPPEMDSVIVNEAVELAKKYGDEQDYQFINGVLGSVSRKKAEADDSGGAAAGMLQ